MRLHLTGLAAILALTGSSMAQGVDLSEGPLVDHFFHVDVAMRLAGRTRVQQGEKTVENPLSAEAHHEFVEKILEAHDGIVEKTVRIYRQAEAVLRFGDNRSSRTFRPERLLLVSQRVQGQNIAYCPHGSLTREEVELTEHFSTQALTGLLPAKEVKIGESWAVSKSVAQTLCALEGLVSTELTCKLEEVRNHLAIVQVKGSVNGIDLGVDVKITVDGHYQFDLKQKRLTQLSWKQVDERDQGPACPALTANVEISVRREVAQPPAELNALVLGGLLPAGKTPPAERTLIAYADPSGRFSIQYPREWIMTAQAREHTVWRLMNRGDLVAQVTIAPWSKLDPGKMMPFDSFLDAIARTPTWTPERIEEKNDTLTIEGNRAYRYAAAGKLDGSDVVQYFYLLASPRGDHLFVTFTLSPSQVKTLNFRNEGFVHGISMPR